MDEAEWKTRRNRIDKRLRGCNPPWDIIPYRAGLDCSQLSCQAVREFNAFTTPRNNKFAQEYEIYSQRFQKEDFGDDDPFDPKVLPNEYLTAPKPSHTFVYISTIQRMARNLFGAQGCFAQSIGDPDLEEDADKLDIPIHAFDVIIADECHRGYTAQEMSIWRETINHFDAIKIGLTATPAAHTTALTLPEVIENIWQNVDRDYHVRILTKRLLRIDKDMNAEARLLFAAWIPDGDMGRYAKALPQTLKQDFAGTMKLLRNADFQKLLLEYPRARRVFIETIEEKDTVTSQKLDRYGKFDNAEDYLDAFENFVKTNADKVAALSVLLQHPESWRPAVMEELKRTLNQNGFEPEKLQRAHRAKGFKALADVISIVKHAAIVQLPLLTADERVNRAIDKFRTGHKLTPEQMQWLSLVREHLVKNLSMDEEDFDLTPLLEMRGGKAKARKVFGDIRKLVGELNEAVAA